MNKNYDITNEMKIFIVLLFLIVPNPVLAYNEVIELNDLISYAYKTSTDIELYKIHQELNRKNYEVAMHATMPTLKFSIAPQYSHSISPVTQPDGSMLNKDVNNLYFVPTLSFSTPIPFTGGTLSVSSNFNYYQYKKEHRISKNYSMNIYNINISQPLNFLNLQKWSKRTNRVNYFMNNLQYLKDYLDIKEIIIKQYFDIAKYREILIAYSYLKNNMYEILAEYQQLYVEGKILKQELNEINIVLTELGEKILFNEVLLKHATTDLNNYLNNKIDIDSLKFTIPLSFFVHVDSLKAQNILKQKQILYSNISTIPFKRSLAECKSKRGLDATLNIGLGQNTQSTQISHLFDNKTPSANISISLNVPITDIKSRKAQYHIAKLKLVENQRKNEIESERERNYLALYIEKFKCTKERYNHLLIKENNLKDKMNLFYTLLKAKKVLFEKYHDVINDYLMNKIELLSVLKDIYLLYCQIEELTMYNFVDDINYLNSTNTHIS